MNKITPVIMCGGSGARLWPESREGLPKQFIPLIGDRSTFQSIVGLVGDRTIFEPPVVITNFVFKDAKKFAELCAQAAVVAAAGEIVVFGVTPDHAATGYGYIHPGSPLAVDPQIRRVERFVEKPDEARARTFIDDGYL
jgi:mannose-1-phosphate guanylyltransferase / mannose-6-phosphate isomerase